MKFGNVPTEALASIDLCLPADEALTRQVLTGKPAEAPKVYVGCGNWGHASWVGRVYPARTPATKFREFYPKYFTTMELNATHYSIYGPEVIGQWAAPARGKDFTYCPKFPQQISHYSSFSGIDRITDAFIEGIQAFGENLGPAFLQVSDSFSPAKREPLFQYLSSLPPELDVFLEVRHPDWFKQGGGYFSELASLKKGLVITDTPGRRDAVHMALTVPRLLLRFVCNGDHPTSYKRIDDWVMRIKSWLDKGLEEAHIFLHPGDEVYIPELVHYWTEQLNKHCGLQLPLPYVKQQSLF